MSLLLAGAVVSTAMLSNCSWNHPGRNPYRGTVAEAVARYTDIPAAARRQLAGKIAGGQPDDRVTITRDGVSGDYRYAPEITGMHFGQRTMCDRIDRSGWQASASERAAVYCTDGHCLIVPEVCGNISRIRRLPGAGAGRAASEGGAGGTGGKGMHLAPAPVATEPLAAPASPDTVAAADAMAQAHDVVAQDGAVAADPDSYLMAFPQVGSGMSKSAGRTRPGDTALPQPALVPEPAAAGMLAAGLALLYRRAGRRARAGRVN